MALPAIANRSGGKKTTTFVIPTRYPAGGDVGGPVPVAAGRAFQFGAYPADQVQRALHRYRSRRDLTNIYNPFTPSGPLGASGPRKLPTSRPTFPALAGYDPSAVELRVHHRVSPPPPRRRGGAPCVRPLLAAPENGRLPVHLLCPIDPARDQAVAFSATSVRTEPGLPGSIPHPDSGRHPGPRAFWSPWAVQLPNGQVCALVAAAWGGLGPYSCQPATGSAARAAERSPPAVADCHLPGHAQPWWVARCQAAETSASPFRPLRLKAVWY